MCKPGTQGDPTVGVEFDATVRGDLEQVLLWSEPAINQQELECIRDNLRNAHPMPPLVRNNSSIEQPANNASWVQQQKQLQARLDELIQQQENTIQPGLCAVPFFLLLSPSS